VRSATATRCLSPIAGSGEGRTAFRGKRENRQTRFLVVATCQLLVSASAAKLCDRRADDVSLAKYEHVAI
jgi:hypothetical protein